MSRKFFGWGRAGQASKRRRQARTVRRRLQPLRNSNLGLELLEDRVLLAAGDLDTTFNPAGAMPGVKIGQFATFGSGADSDEGVVTAVQVDGKVVVATQVMPSAGSSLFDVLVTRYNPDGSLDASFGTGGSTSFDFTSGQSLVRDIAIDNSGRIIIVGSGPVVTSRVAVARLLATGALDTSFSGDGLATAFTVPSQANSVAIQSDNKIVVGGYSGSGVSRDFALARFNVNGTLDSTFGTGGLVTTNYFGFEDIVNDIAIQSGGMIVAVGVTDTGSNPANRDFAIARYTSAGVLDSTFGVGGKVNTNIVTAAEVPALTFANDGASAVRIQSDGKIVVAGSTLVRVGLADETDMVVARYDSSGNLDTTLLPDASPHGSISGTRRVHFAFEDIAKDLLIQADGKYLLVGRVNSNSIGAANNTIALARLQGTDGSLDTSFSGDGKQQTSLTPAGYKADQTHIFAAALQPDGKIIVVGAADQTALPNKRDYFVARYEIGYSQSIAGPAIVAEGSPYALTLTSTDPTTTGWTINWGDSTETLVGNPTSVTHVYADGPQNYTITASVTTVTSGTTTVANTVSVAVLNVSPALVISGAATVSEGSSYTLNMSSNDPGADTISSWTINWGDGNTEVVPGNPASASHTYLDGNNSYVITAAATDDDGTFAAGNTVPVSVQNVAPSLTVDNATVTIDEGQTATNSGTFGDVAADTVTLAASIGAVTGSAGAWSWSYTAPDDLPTTTVTITASDDDGGTTSVTFDLTINNLDPSLAVANASVTVNEGQTASNSGSFGDVAADTVTLAASIGTVTGSAGAWAWSYVTSDDAPSQTVTITASDEDGGSTSVSFGLFVNNVAPTLALSGAADVNEGDSYTLALSSLDPGADTIASWTINWGDGVEVVTGNPASVTHVYADGDANHTISATATDEDGAYAAGNSVAVAVHNVAPTLVISGASDVNEGDSYTLSLSSLDAGADTITSWTINWGDGTEVITGNPASVTHVYADGNAGSIYTIAASATDEDGTFVAGNTVVVTVLNVAPTANAGGPYQTFDDTPITLSGTATDAAGAADTLTYAWDLDGDSVFGETGAGATRGNEVGASVTYDPTGLGNSTQTVQLQVSDDDGGVTTVSTTIQTLGTGTFLVGGVLHIVGSSSCDIAVISKAASSIIVIATFNANNPVSFAEASVTEIQVRVRGGSDLVVTTPHVTKAMTIDGGDGNDMLTGGGGRNVILGGAGHDILYSAGGDDVLLGGSGNDDLIGGSGNDVLVGGDGNDILRGGLGRDLLIGSQNDDRLDGGTDEDVLIGGVTIHDTNVAALDAVMAIWGSAASFSARVATLTSTGGLLEAGVAVFDDDDNDVLVGGAGRDLYFGDNNPWDGAVDSISLQALQDQLIAVT